MVGVECFTPDNGITHYSRKHPERCVREVLPGFVMYVREGMTGVRKGLVDQCGAFDWLSGRDLSEIKHYTVVT